MSSLSVKGKTEKFFYTRFTENPVKPFCTILELLESFGFPERVEIHTCAGAGWPIVFSLLPRFVSNVDIRIYCFDKNQTQIGRFSDILIDEGEFDTFLGSEVLPFFRRANMLNQDSKITPQDVNKVVRNTNGPIIDIIRQAETYLSSINRDLSSGYAKTKRILFLSNILDYYRKQYDQSDQYISSLADLITTYLSVFDAVIITTHPAFEGKYYQVDYDSLIEYLRNLGYIVKEHGLSDASTIVIEKQSSEEPKPSLGKEI
jgi:hypothetical protein